MSTVKEFYCLVFGTTNPFPPEHMARALDRILQDHDGERVYIVTGNDDGADKLAQGYAKERGCKLSVFYADWSTFHQAAGKIRTDHMVGFVSKHADNMAIFFDDGDKKKGGGIGYKINEVKKAGIPMRTVFVKK